MSEIAIQVRGLSKLYKIGERKLRHDSLGEQLTDVFNRSFRRLFVLSNGSDNGRRVERPSTVQNSDNSTLWALKDVSFEIRQGDVVGIVGRNGAGKSTLLKVLTRITEPTSGRAEIYGRIGSLLEVGTGFHPELTGRENIYLNGAILGMTKTEIQRKFDAIVDFAEVERFIDTPVKRYSSGMYVRLAFAVAAHLEPEILIVDEVLAVGDSAFQKKCLGKMGDVAKEGRTVLFVSHNTAAVSNLTTRCICMEQGRVVAQGATDYVLRKYLHGHTDERCDAGEANLEEAFRHPELTGEKARFESVRILDDENARKGTLFEGESFTVECCVQVRRTVQRIQIGCAFEAMKGGVELFTAVSPEWSRKLEPGKYVARLYINPSYFCAGEYSIALKLFADGQRQDTIADAVRFNVFAFLAPQDNQAFLQMWAVGHMRFDYRWGSVTRADCLL